MQRMNQEFLMEEERPTPSRFSSFYKKGLFGAGIFGFLITVCVLSALAFKNYQSDFTNHATPSQSSQASSDLLNSLTSKDRTFSLNLGQRNNLRSCDETSMKQTFPDLDYALLGYNLLKGYPHAMGHDPGLTFPIFTADYSSGKHTSDCQYLVPHGFVLVPDVACRTSFSSKIIRTRLELSHSLSTSVSAEGGGFGVSFSASAGYKSTANSVSSGDYTYIISTATCKYYYGRIDEMDPPQFNDGFRMWIQRLNNTHSDDQKEYINFFETFGTHFLKGVVFGAKYIYEHKMKSTQYSNMTSKSIDVSASASYSGLISVGGGFSLSNSQRSAATNFQNHVTTTTISIGAPPPSNGDTLTWASTVKDTPIPVHMELSSIENLFSDKYMKKSSIDCKKISLAIKRYKTTYCRYLHKDGGLDECGKQKIEAIVFNSTSLTRVTVDGEHPSVRRRIKTTSTDKRSCILSCLQKGNCVALQYCETCEPESRKTNLCFMFTDEEMADVRGKNESNFQSMIFPTTIKGYVKLHKTGIIGVHIQSSKKKHAGNMTECMDWCFQRSECVAFSHCKCLTGEDSQHCPCSKETHNCKLFNRDGITMLTKEEHTSAYILSNQVYSAKEAIQLGPHKKS